MTIAIGSTPGKQPWRTNFKDAFGKTITKTALLGGSITDTHFLELATDMNYLSNADFVSMTLNERVVTGLNGSATDAVFPTVANLAEFTFSHVDPVNSALTVYRSFLIPAPINDTFKVDGSIDDTGTWDGSTAPTDAPGYIARLITNLQNYLVLVDHAGTIHTGSWTFEPTKSGLVTIPSA